MSSSITPPQQVLQQARSPATAPLTGQMAVRVYLCFALGYLISYVFRTSNAVIAPYLRADLHLTDADLGLLSSAYFFSFALMQLPLGIWLDKYGPRRLEAGLLCIAAAGAAVFAMSESLLGLWVGRAMVGIGVSACLMAAFTGFRMWYAPAIQGRLASLMLVAGTAGALVATVPVSFAITLVGWRGVFWILCGMVLVAVILILFVLKEPERVNQRPKPKAAPVSAPGGGYKMIFTHPYFLRVLPMAVITVGVYAAIHTLWAGPWMTLVLGFDNTLVANVLFGFNLLMLSSHLGLSWLAPRLAVRSDKGGWSVHRLVWISAGSAIIIETVMVVFAAPWTWMVLILLSACMTITILVQVNVAMSFPASFVGRANSAFNFLVFVGSFLMQWSIGLMSDGFQSLEFTHANALRGALAVCILLQIGVLVAYLLNKAEPEKHE